MLAFAIACGAVVSLVLLHWRDRKQLKKRRSQFFQNCLELFTAYRVVQLGQKFPELSGRYRGHEIRLEPLIDDMAWRRVPVLWLRVTVLTPNSYRGVLSLLVRPGAVEVYSPSAELDHHLPLPDGWPEQALLTTDDPTARAPLDRLTPLMAVFADPYMKELVVTSKGVRLVRMIWQASRIHYAVFREVRFEEIHLDAAVVKTLLDEAVAMADLLSQPGSIEEAA